ncbi:MAG: hypothetical protein ACPG5P_06445 [Saprospiraceae bacterium]
MKLSSMADLKLNDEYDLVIEDGDFALIDGDEKTIQDAELIIISNQGEWKEHPLVGCNLIQMMNAKYNETAIRRRIRLQLKADGIDYDTVKHNIKLN